MFMKYIPEKQFLVPDVQNLSLESLSRVLPEISSFEEEIPGLIRYASLEVLCDYLSKSKGYIYHPDPTKRLYFTPAYGIFGQGPDGPVFSGWPYKYFPMAPEEAFKKLSLPGETPRRTAIAIPTAEVRNLPISIEIVDELKDPVTNLPIPGTGRGLEISFPPGTKIPIHPPIRAVLMYYIDEENVISCEM